MRARAAKMFFVFFFGYFQYLELRFCKAVRNIVTGLFLLLGIFHMPVFLYIPSLAYSEGATK